MVRRTRAGTLPPLALKFTAHVDEHIHILEPLYHGEYEITNTYVE